jgi:crotonobetainyl-CoA:carnitine CoA-transferase CaiB-like acyl-CoA transferase
VTLLDGIVVLDLSEGIAGGYATKLLADAGALIEKIERQGGDPLRRWTASRTKLQGEDGALFKYLHAGKRSRVGDLDDVAALLPGASLVVESGRLSTTDIGHLRTSHPALPILSISPFGRTGPWADHPSTEFTLQALCGSIAGRGTPDREPLQAGGAIGEWAAGAYAAIAALAAVRSAVGDHIDVSILECMAIVLGGYGAVHMALGGTLEKAKLADVPFRSVELPGITATADGLVGFCTGTGQQFEDFLVMIGHPELIGDERFHTLRRRLTHQLEFEQLVESWATIRTTDEILAEAGAFRIPCAPIGSPSTIARFEQFVARKVFVPDASGQFVQPRSPYRVHGDPDYVAAPCPLLGEHQSAPPANGAPKRRVGADALPLAGLRIVDMTAFWSGPSATQMLASLGADVIKVESHRRPDGMRFTSVKTPADDRWWEWSGFHHAAATNKRAIAVDLEEPEGRALVLELIERSDGLVENYSPRVLDRFGITWDEVHRRNPATIMVRMPGFGLDGPWRDRTGFAQTMEQLSGMAWLTGFADGLPMIPRGPCDPLAGMHAVVAFLAALTERERTGQGRFIEVTMIEAALAVAAEIGIEYSAYGVELRRDGNRGPAAAPQGLYACAGAEQWLALAIRDDADWQAFVRVLGSPEWAGEVLDTDAGRRANHDLIDQHLIRWASERELHATVATLLDAGIPAAPVLSSARVFDHPQLRARCFPEPVEHPLAGTYEVPGVPFRFESRSGAWFRRAAPMLGEHNHEVLRDVLDLSDDAVADLKRRGVIGDRIP